jgi:12,18-didecarboxysiroheme deacetylase
MIGVSKLYCGTVESSDALRYERDSRKMPSHLLQFSADKRPVVVWNVGRRCNLRCVHCYSHSRDQEYGGELTTKQGEALIDDLAAFKAPVMLFSGGEPFMRPDVLQLARRAKAGGMRVVFSTNGTLIDEKMANELAEIGLSYAGISIDGLRETNDRFRGVKGAFDLAIQGIRNCKKAGIKVGLRFTINKINVADVPGIFKLLEDEDIPRVCFYHLVYAGRGSKLVEEDLDAAQTRATVDQIIDLTADLHKRDKTKEVLTVDNHADGVHLYLRMVREKSPRAADVLKLLKMNGGNNTGIAIGCVSWDGSVHADQFWRHYSFGNVKDRPFSQIWTDTSNELMAGLKNRRHLLKGKCGRCVWQDICNGNFRVRAEAIHDDVWAEDPACFLTEEEISTRIEPPVAAAVAAVSAGDASCDECVR